jgi:hypothetical protein
MPSGDNPEVTTRNRPGRRTAGYLALGVVITLALFWIPGGHYVAYPLMLISTVAHEMGHGLAALLVGGRFESLKMWPNGSGVAAWSAAVGALGRAIVAAGGLVGPALAAALAFWAGREAKHSQAVLGILAAGLLLAEVLVVRNLFGFLFIGVLALLLGAVALRAPAHVAQITLLFLGVQLALSSWSRSDYLFTDVAMTAQGPMPSDVAQIADALWLPYWFWGGLCALFSLLVIGLGLTSLGPKRTAGVRRR